MGCWSRLGLVAVKSVASDGCVRRLDICLIFKGKGNWLADFLQFTETLDDFEIQNDQDSR